jgi:exopolysaccharide biosynthesis polyprenyl glycosylphosphotransferase
MIPWPHRRKAARRVRADRRVVLIVGAASAGRALAARLRRDAETECEVCGFADDARTGPEVLGRVRDLSRIIRKHFVDEVILTPPHDREVVRQVVREARRNHISVTLVPELFGLAPRAVSFGTLGDLPVLKLDRKRLPKLPVLLKRFLDITVSLTLIPWLALLGGLIAVLIKLDSPGPVFYRDVRAGKKGRTFTCYKFRSMVAGAHERQDELRMSNEREGPFFKIADDPRITRVGRFLRRYSLDELPQLWNVLKGDMSLVGPRPHPLADFQRYELDHLRRLNVTPGLTGLWQVRARTDPSFERNMQLDIEYIERWSFGFDLKILLATVPVVFRGTGA